MTLDATVAGPDANSYLELEEADAFAETDAVNGEAWLTADEAPKERALLAATNDVDLYKRTAGVRYSSVQALLFPRDTDLDDSALPILVADVRRATYEQAVYLLRNAKLLADAAARRARALYSFSDDDGSATQALSPSFGLYAPKMTEYLDRIGAAGRSTRTLVSVPMTSSYE